MLYLLKPNTIITHTRAGRSKALAGLKTHEGFAVK